MPQVSHPIVSTQEFAEAGKTVAQSQEILRELESTLLAVKEMEARQLTVLASGSETTRPSTEEVSAINLKFARLKELASGADGRLEECRSWNAMSRVRWSCCSRSAILATLAHFQVPR